MLRSTDTCQNKVSADQYHVTISWAQVDSSSRSSGQSAKTADWLEHNDVNWLVLHNCACA